AQSESLRRGNGRKMGLKKKSFGEKSAERKSHFRDAVAQGLYVLGVAIKTVFGVLGKIIRPLLTTAGIILIAILANIWFASVVGIIFGYPLLNYLLPNVPFITAIGITNVLLLIGLPVVGLISFVMRMLFRARMNKKWAWGINLVWVINLFCLIMLGVFVGKQ